MVDHSFFDKFFDDTPRHKCNRCSTEEDLHPIGNTGGSMLYLCTECRNTRDAELQESIERECIEIELWTEHDRQEEQG